MTNKLCRGKGDWLASSFQLILILLAVRSTLTTAELDLKERLPQDILDRHLERWLEQRIDERLTEKVEQQLKLLLRPFQTQIDMLSAEIIRQKVQISSLLEKGSNSNNKNIKEPFSAGGKISDGLYRSCYETYQFDLTLGSGMYWIDPDGLGIGDDPIYVYCDMATGSTAILHDSEPIRDVGHCLDPGCYSRPIVYNATEKQIQALIGLSAECLQSIRYDCNYAPFVVGDITYSWWNDRKGQNQTFWSGSGSTEHICQCGIDGNCVDIQLPCNCDALLPLPISDSGVITNKDFLPISRLNFGRTQLSSSSGKHTLGRLVCSGAVPVDGLPTSCQDLWRIGYQLSGFYSVKGEKSIDMVYCDFGKPLTDSNFQKWFGQVGVTSSPIYFDAYRNSVTSALGILKYDGLSINTGGAMNPTTGTFTAPRKGTYLFVFTGYATDVGLKEVFVDVDLVVAGRVQGRNSCYNHGGGYTDSATIQTIVELNVNDKVYVNVSQVSGAEFFDDPTYHHNRFSGLLLREDVI